MLPPWRSGIGWDSSARSPPSRCLCWAAGCSAMFGPSWLTSKTSTEALAQKYPAGAKVTVHYDPEDPQTAVLDVSDAIAQENNWRVRLFVIFPFAFTVMVAIVNR